MIAGSSTQIPLDSSTPDIKMYTRSFGRITHTITLTYWPNGNLRQRSRVTERRNNEELTTTIISTTYLYDLGGRLISPIRRYIQRNRYDQSNMLIREYQYNYAYDTQYNRISSHRIMIRYTYTPKGELATRINSSYFYNATHRLVSSSLNKLTYTYNADGTVKEETYEYNGYDAARNRVAYAYTATKHSYYANGDTYSVASSFDSDGNLVSKHDTTSIYDENGTLKEIIIIQEYYNENGLLLERVEMHNFNDDSGNPSWSTIDTRNYTYNGNDSLNTVTASWSSQNADGSPIASGTSLSTYFYNGDNSLREIVKESHSYDGLGNPLESITETTRYTYSGNGLITEIQHETYYYDAQNNLVSSTLEVRKYDSNEALIDWRIYFYDADGNLIDVQVYDTDGNVILQSNEIREKADLNHDGELTEQELAEYEAAVQALIPTIQVTDENRIYDVDGNGRILNRDIGCLQSFKDMLLDAVTINSSIQNPTSSDIRINVTGDITLDSNKTWDFNTIVIDVTGSLDVVPSTSGYDIYVNGEMLIESDTTIDLSAYSIYVSGDLTIRSGESVILSSTLPVVVTGASEMQTGLDITVEGGEKQVVDIATVLGDQEVLARLELQTESAATKNKDKLTFYNDLKPRKSKYLDWLKN